jgi:hypothetical protein
MTKMLRWEDALVWILNVPQNSCVEAYDAVERWWNL